MTDKRSGISIPPIGTVVLLVDEDQPRKTWRMGRISALKTSRDNAIREAEMTLPNGHVLRRAFNLLVPLEIERSTQGPQPKSDPRRQRHNTYQAHSTFEML
ncbi:hypothetical protein ANCCAN_18196 [Ancylostoma caninum]|uniref:DUF5641 domain-containing protein n=1 Tax=Ancylostoma caninum TaxID=29170 RepID=A0A368FUU2_ANCCA|nr:hypothetical protein ANCCAN_18196 [Ancylostoma caninum]